MVTLLVLKSKPGSWNGAAGRRRGRPEKPAGGRLNAARGGQCRGPQEKLGDGYLDQSAAQRLARRILHENARGFFEASS